MLISHVSLGVILNTKKPCVAILLNGNLLREWSTVKYLRVTFESGVKLKVSLAAKRMKFFRAFNYIYACVGSTASPMLLCHLLHTYCLPILLYGLEAVTMLISNPSMLLGKLPCIKSLN